VATFAILGSIGVRDEDDVIGVMQTMAVTVPACYLEQRRESVVDCAQRFRWRLDPRAHQRPARRLRRIEESVTRHTLGT
ncbi:hypothetical protein WAI99_20780, partial [Acinetobacter baumannii]